MTGASETARPRILIIEDNRGDVFLLQEALQAVGIEPEFTVLEDGGEALAHLCRAQQSGGAEPHLVVLDLNLPTLSGLELLAAARERHCLGASPVVVLSSSQSSRDKARAMALGVVRYLVKPADLEEFLALGPVLAGLLHGPESTAAPA